jgi:hypothetical protein
MKLLQIINSQFLLYFLDKEVKNGILENRTQDVRKGSMTASSPGARSALKFALFKRLLTENAFLSR